PGGVVERRASQRIAGVNRNSGIEEPLRVGNVAGANGGVERFSSGRQRGSLRKRRDQRAREQAQDRDPANHAPSVSPRNRIYGGRQSLSSASALGLLRTEIANHPHHCLHAFDGRFGQNSMSQIHDMPWAGAGAPQQVRYLLTELGHGSEQGSRIE